MALLEIRDVYKTYKMGDSIIRALRGVSLDIEEGDFVAIMGPSGSGKSTLMHTLGLLDTPETGSYRIRGKEASKLSEDELAVLRREAIGFIFQQFNLLPRMSAAENVVLPLMYSEQEMDLDRGKKLLERVGLGARIHHRPNELSGGQQQRVAIARSLVNRPAIILADEPTGNLDSTSSIEIMNALKELNASGITIVIVTHEDDIAKQAKRLIRMRDGEVQSDERLEPFKKPASENSTPSKPKSPRTLLNSILPHFRQGIKTLMANKVRTVLSMLGILIGVAAVVAMLAVGHGAQKAIEEQLSSLGSNLLVLRPGSIRVGGAMIEAGTTTRLTEEDASFIKEKISKIKDSAAYVNGRGQVTYLNKNWNTNVMGTASVYAKIHAMIPDVGRFFTDEENKRRSRVAVIGRTVVNEVFDGENPIGEEIKINKVSFQVIGVLPEKGANSFRDQDDMVIIPLLTAMHRLLGKDYVDAIDIEVENANDTDVVEREAMQLMISRHKVPLSQTDAFQIRNMADIQAALSSSASIMTLLLSIIAAISLVVGGIGIMNIMLVSVTERTREIGLRKAVGARRSDILIQFLIEAVVITIIGGGVGIALAWIVTLTLTAFAGWATSITASSIFLALFFSATTGIIFGLYPARKASLLPPIDALRYE